MSAKRSIPEKFLGSWNVDHSENFDEYLENRNLNYLKKKPNMSPFGSFDQFLTMASIYDTNSIESNQKESPHLIEGAIRNTACEQGTIEEKKYYDEDLGKTGRRMCYPSDLQSREENPNRIESFWLNESNSNRNKKRVEKWKKLLQKEETANWAYEYHLPSNIPQNINI